LFVHSCTGVPSGFKFQEFLKKLKPHLSREAIDVTDWFKGRHLTYCLLNSIAYANFFCILVQVEYISVYQKITQKHGIEENIRKVNRK
jgi:hypothetical protein